ncbi:carcinoembryonic antigen-related cell adhesion molecule 1-like [Peromyscus eremicus]|uniref:carcinoembryonic antigen-related cell adhesion molecule 1-like n=1 Tax=Peromyscus eremicus TaxID=42410 RepID=UPI0027DD0841|nr:carcinoembryonic antigen-related cell adhesion molecule 1-like [Peromyscus eremicus]
MELTSAPLHKGQVFWRRLLLTASILTSWTSATPDYYGPSVPIEAVPPHVAEGDNLLIRIPNIGKATISWFRELGFGTLEWARLAQFSKSKGVYWKGEQYTDRHKIYDNGSMFIQNISNANGGKYDVFIHLDDRRVMLFATGIVHVYRELPLPFIQFNTTTLKELDPVFLTCSFHIPHYNALRYNSIRWLLNGQSLELTNRMKLSQKNSTLTIDPVIRKDSGEYQCELYNSQSSKRSNVIQLDIIVSPTTAQVTVEAVPPHVAEGDNVLLLVHNLPATLQAFYWYRRETDVERNKIAGYLMFSNIKNTGPAYSGREMIYPNGSLLLQKATQKDAGAYMLYMVTENFNFRSASLQIRVHKTVTTLSIQVTNTTLKELDSVFLACFSNELETSISWFFNAISIYWLFNGQMLGLTNRMKLSQNNSTLRIYPVRREDSGNYQCRVSNPASSKRSNHIRLRILPSPTTAQVTVEAVPPHLAEGKNVLLLVHTPKKTVHSFYWHKGESAVKRNVIAQFLISNNTNETGPAYSGREMMYPNGSLFFQNVTQKDAGIYLVFMIMENFHVMRASVQFTVHPK